MVYDFRVGIFKAERQKGRRAGGQQLKAKGN
jgi:hypothetical protein